MAICWCRWAWCAHDAQPCCACCACRRQLAVAHEALVREAEAREKLEENMKQAFMRGVCALNIEVSRRGSCNQNMSSPRERLWYSMSGSSPLWEYV